jgi:hypothetical protein
VTIVAALLDPPTEIVEEAQKIGRYSRIKGEVHVFLQRPARFPPSLKEIRNDLTPLFFLNMKSGKESSTF